MLLAFLSQVRDLLKVEWVQGDPARGLEYVYLAEEDYQKVHASVKATLSVQTTGEYPWEPAIASVRSLLERQLLAASNYIRCNLLEALDESKQRSVHACI